MSSGQQNPTKWGVVSVGKISKDFVMAVQTLDPAEHEIVACAARDHDRAQEFAKDFGIKKAYGSHEEMAFDSDVEICYIGAINTGHVELCKLMMEHGKHVLCEKPLALRPEEVRELVDFAKAKKVFFMEAMWSRFNPCYKELQKRLKDNYIGDILHVQSTFGLPLAHLPRIADPELGGGTLGDIGEYCIHLAMLVFPGEKPEKVLSTGQLNEKGVDISGSVILVFPGGKTATFSYTSLANLPNEGFVIGTKGILKLCRPFWASEVLEDMEKNEELHHVPRIELSTIYVNSYILRYEAQECRDCLLKGLKESPNWTWCDTILIHDIKNKINEQLGVVHAKEQ